MIHSMTAFARVEEQVDGAALCWEIKSVNHRYLEASFRLPESFRALEANLRAALRQSVHRGKIECHLKINTQLGAEKNFKLNESLACSLVEVAAQASDTHHLANDFTVSQLLNYPGVCEQNQSDVASTGQEVEHKFKEAISQLVQVRATEGESLKKIITERLSKLRLEVEQVSSAAEKFSRQAKEKVLSRLQNIDMDVNENRIEQEVAILLTRMDIREELDRLQTHIDEVEDVLSRKGAVGRRLDFLMQELNREANTLSSKSDSSELTKHAVEMKVLIEQMREQIQNIE